MGKGLSIFRRNDLIKGLGWPVVLATALVCGLLIREPLGDDAGWLAGIGVVILLGLPLLVWSFFGQRCPRCRSNLARHGWAVGPTGGWVRTGDLSRSRYATAAQRCAVCDLDLTNTRFGDWPNPAPEAERAQWIRDYQQDRRDRRNRSFTEGS